MDDKGNTKRNVLSPEFLNWVKINNVPVADAFREQTGIFPAELGLMASTGDPRALLILRKGLYSPNPSVQWIPAKGLARLQDKDSIRAIIEDARRAPADMKGPIAETLLFFDDPEARAAAEEMITDKDILADTKKTVKERGVRGLW